MKASSLAQEGRARFVVTMPPSPSRIEAVLASTPAAKLLAMTETADAFRHLAGKAQHRLRIAHSISLSIRATCLGTFFGWRTHCVIC